VEVADQGAPQSKTRVTAVARENSSQIPECASPS
jgi:hypothetical protein